MKVMAQRLRYIVSFIYDGKKEKHFSKVCESIDGSGKWRYDSIKYGDRKQDVYEFILDQFNDPSDDTNIGCAFRYDDVEDLPEITYRRPEDDGDHVEIRISDMGLFLFRSRVGLLWYEIGMDEPMDSDDLIVFQNRFKELGRKASRQFSISGGLTVGDIVAQALEPLDLDITFFDKKENHISAAGRPTPERANLFTYVVLSPSDYRPDHETYRETGHKTNCEADPETDCAADPDREIINEAFWLTSGYNRNFIPLPDVEKTFFHPFGNMWWNLKKEGCGCFVRYDGPKSTFFVNPGNMPSKVMTDYFLLYILLMHQDHALIRYASEIEGSLPADSDHFSSHKTSYISTMEDILATINTFLAKNIYTSVSYIDHQNEFYLYGARKLRIRENAESLSLGMDALADMQQIQEDHRDDARSEMNERNERLSEMKMNIFLAVFSLMTVFSATTDMSSLFEKGAMRYGSPLFDLLLGFIVAATAFLIYELINNGKRYRRAHKRASEAEKKFEEEYGNGKKE